MEVLIKLINITNEKLFLYNLNICNYFLVEMACVLKFKLLIIDNLIFFEKGLFTNLRLKGIKIN